MVEFLIREIVSATLRELCHTVTVDMPHEDVALMVDHVRLVQSLAKAFVEMHTGHITAHSEGPGPISEQQFWRSAAFRAKL